MRLTANYYLALAAALNALLVALVPAHTSASAIRHPKHRGITLSKRAYTGDGTVYFPGTGGLSNTGACGNHISSSDFPGACALGSGLFDASRPCGACINVCGPNGCSRCTVQDRCEGCGYSHLDMTYETFKQVGGATPSRVPVTWEIVDCNSWSQAVAAPPPPPPPPAVAPAADHSTTTTTTTSTEAPSQQGGLYQCIQDGKEPAVLSPVRRTPGGDVACLSADSTHCLEPSSLEACHELANAAGEHSAYVECGARHAALWGGSTGYENPDHWCSRARAVLN